MAPIFGVLFIAAIAFASPLKEAQPRYEKMMHDIEFAEMQYRSLPDPKEQLHYTNAYSILRLSAHLEMNFKEIQEQVLDEMCGGQSICYGSPAFQKGVIKVCLHSDDYVSHQVELYENFTRCSNDLLSELINEIESTKEKMNELRYSRMKLMQEYSDSSNRHELEMVLDYHEEIINEGARVLLDSFKKLHQLYESLANAMKNCSAHGYPRINRKFYTYPNVRQCMRDFLTTEPHHGYVHVPEESHDQESEGPHSPEEVSENPHEQNQELHEEPNEPNQESHEKPQESYEEYKKKEANNPRDSAPITENPEIHGYPDNENHENEDAQDDNYFIHD